MEQAGDDKYGYQLVRLIWVDYAGIRRCRVIPRKRLKQIQISGIGLASACLFMPCWGDSPPSNDPAGQPCGECRLIPDIETLKRLPWRPSESMCLVSMISEIDSTPWDACPRTLLFHALELFELEFGVELKAGFEVEFSLLEEKPKNIDLSNKTTPRVSPIEESVYCQTSAIDGKAGPVLKQICACLEQLGQNIEQIHAESASGQFELVTEYRPALEAADNLIYKKETISAVARLNKMTASFLPKIFPDQAGNGCHVHFSFGDPKEPDSNLMADSSRPYSLSALGEAFSAGVLKHMPALMSFTAGNVNSYERIKASTWSGAYQCWGVNNREAPLRLVGLAGQPESINFELKTVDGTANPYIALAAIIAAGISGIRRGLSLSSPVQVDPASLTEEQREKESIRLLPSSLPEALDAFEKDDEFKNILVEVTGSETMCRLYPIVKGSEFEKMVWNCQFPGPCSFCPVCNTCQEGPGGTPGGCGHCKFCSPVACPTPECVGDTGEATIATATASARNANLKGRVLVLDVNSWEESNGAQNLPRVVTAAQCAQVCQLTAGCNGWTFCYKPEGCGMQNECRPMEQGDTDQRKCSQLGPFGKCTTPESRFPFLMCSLKRVESDIETLEYYPDGTDWSSGVINAQGASPTASQVEAFPINELCQL